MKEEKKSICYKDSTGNLKMSTLNCTHRNETTSLTNRVFQASSLSLILLVAVYLNAKTFYVIFKQKRESKKAVTIFLLNMTFVSGLVALLLMPFNIHAIIETTWVFGEIFCQVSKQGKTKREVLHWMLQMKGPMLQTKEIVVSV